MDQAGYYGITREAARLFHENHPDFLRTPPTGVLLVASNLVLRAAQEVRAGHR
jgi:hypothetical protein